jgi:hypothetical protein
MNDEDLNGTPEQRVIIPEGQEYLGGTGITSMQFMKAHPVLTLKGNDYEANSIVFYAGQGNEMMRINAEGFYWKGNLVEKDKEIYLKVKEFFNMPKHE